MAGLFVSSHQSVQKYLLTQLDQALARLPSFSRPLNQQYPTLALELKWNNLSLRPLSRIIWPQGKLFLINCPITSPVQPTPKCLILNSLFIPLCKIKLPFRPTFEMLAVLIVAGSSYYNRPLHSAHAAWLEPLLTSVRICFHLTERNLETVSTKT